MVHTALKIENGVKRILPDQYADQNITDIIFPDSVEEIGERAFAGCQDLKRLWLPRSVKRIGKEAFWGCGKLQRVFIPDSVESIGHDAFDYRTCEIFCEAPRRPSGWYCDYYEMFDYDDQEGQMILSKYESWCGYDVEVRYPEWASESITSQAEPRSLRWDASEDKVRAIWEQEDWVLERDKAERMTGSIQHIRDSERQVEDSELSRIGQKIEAAKQDWMEACAPYQNPQEFYPEEILPAASAYIDALEELKDHYSGRHDLNQDYRAAWEIFRVYCELAPRFADASFRKGLDSMKETLERMVYYGAGFGGGASAEREHIAGAYEACMAQMKPAGSP